MPQPSLARPAHAHVPGAVPVPVDADVRPQHARDEPSGGVRREIRPGPACRSKKSGSSSTTVSFPENAEPRTISQQILSSVGLDGAHGVTRRKDGAIVINRNDLLTPRRLTYSPADRAPAHREDAPSPQRVPGTVPSPAGLCHRLPLDTVWAVSVDLVIVAMVFWVVSGLWMWWEMKATRRLGAVGPSSAVRACLPFTFWCSDRTRHDVLPLQSPPAPVPGARVAALVFHVRHLVGAVRAQPVLRAARRGQRPASLDAPIRARGRPPRSGRPGGAAAPRRGAPRDSRNRQAPASAPTGRARRRSTCTRIRSGNRRS